MEIEQGWCCFLPSGGSDFLTSLLLDGAAFRGAASFSLFGGDFPSFCGMVLLSPLGGVAFLRFLRVVVLSDSLLRVVPLGLLFLGGAASPLPPSLKSSTTEKGREGECSTSQRRMRRDRHFTLLFFFSTLFFAVLSSNYNQHFFLACMCFQYFVSFEKYLFG